jgi:hypothetical protein
MTSVVRGVAKSKFTSEEDDCLMMAVMWLSIMNRCQIEYALPGRNNKQCRGRGNNYINSVFTKTQWTQAEDAFLMQKYQEFVLKWAVITTAELELLQLTRDHRDDA